MAAGQRVILVIATDGLPTSPGCSTSLRTDREAFVQSLRKLMLDLPVNVVIRFCTEDDDTLSCDGDIESDLELPLDVFDDLASEAKELQQRGKGWFTCTEMLYRVCEGGTFTKLFDLLDERQLTPTEVSVFAQWLLHGEADPPLSSDPIAFADAMGKLLCQAGPVFDAYRRRMLPPVDVCGLKRALAGRSLTNPMWQMIEFISQISLATCTHDLHHGLARGLDLERRGVGDVCTSWRNCVK